MLWKAKLVALLFLACICVVFCQDATYTGPGPEDILRREGATHVFIPCPFFFGVNIPIWLINGQAYGIFNVPPPFVYSLPDSLGVTVVTRDLNGTTFQCYTQIGPEIYSSGIGTLTVEFSDAPVTNHSFSAEIPGGIKLDYQHISLLDRNKTLSWVVANRTKCPSPPYELQALRCIIPLGRGNYFEEVHNWTSTSDKNITVPSDELSQKNQTFHLKLVALDNEDCSLNGVLEIPPDMIIQKMPNDPHQNVCIPVPYSEKKVLESLWVVWPMHLTDQDREANPNSLDCVCPITCGFMDFRKQCPCLNNEAMTPYKIAFVNNTVDCLAPNYTICWQDIDPGMNNTKIYFYAESMPCEEGTPSRRYLSATHIIINGAPPNPPNVTVNGTTLNICSDDLDTLFPVELYNVSITDVTWEVSKKYPDAVPRKENMTCTLHSVSANLKPEVCSPFVGSIWAFSEDGWSNPNKTTINDHIQADPCACIKEKVDSNMAKKDVKHDRILVQFNCSKLFAVSSMTNITVKLKRADIGTCTPGDKSNCQDIVVQCNGTTQNLPFANLSGHTSYTISSFWNSTCQLKVVQAKTLKLSDSTILVLEITVPLAAAVFLAAVAAVISGVCCCCCHCNCCKGCPCNKTIRKKCGCCKLTCGSAKE